MNRQVTMAVMLTLGRAVLLSQAIAPDPQAISAVRPLKEVAEKIESLYAKPVTYEEPERVWRGDLKVVGKNENAKFALFPKDRTFRLPVVLGSSETPTLDASLVNRILDAYHAENDGARFRLISSSYGLHIVPAQYNEEGGRLVAVGSLLDAVVAIPRETRTPDGHLDALCRAITASSATMTHAGPSMQFTEHFAPGGTVCPGGGPSIADYPGAPGLAAGCLFDWGTAAVPARAALINLLEQSSTTMTWRLLCQPSAKPEDRECTLNVGPLIVTAPRADGSPRRHYLLYDRCTKCPPPGRNLAPVER